MSKGPLSAKSAQEKTKLRTPQPGRAAPLQTFPSERYSLFESGPFLSLHRSQKLGRGTNDDKLTTCLLDNGSQLNFVTPTYARERGMDILSLDTLAREIGGQLPPIAIMGGGMIKPEGFVIMNVRVPCVKGYNEDQIAIVLEDPEMKDCPVVLGMPTLFRVMEVIKESEISE